MTEIAALAGYELETLSRDGELALLRGVRDSSSLLVLTPVTERPGPSSVERIEHVWALREQLDSAWTPRPRVLEHHRGQVLLVLDDPGGELLSRWVGRSVELTALLRVAIGLAVSMGHLHRRGLVHQDVKPDNVLVDFPTGQAWLSGLSVASLVSRERKGLQWLDSIKGTPAYMAPEQTGRMNRSIDSRSDLYSVGVTFYELLTGSLPFSASDLMEWVHCHVAREPRPPLERPNGELIPAAVAEIVLKLLAKVPEDRYQSASGLELDLRRCLSKWQAHARIERFPLGLRDSSERLLLPERLYGRERELGALQAAFERVLALGRPELVLVSGYSGVGKSSLVNELHKALVARRAVFATGKCDEFKRDIPYGTLARAFRSVVREVLGKSDAEVRTWREALREAVDRSGQLIVNLVPELELIVGPQPALSELSPKEAQHRFQAVFQRFIAAVARPEHPLVLFLDDLQWLDAATLELVEWLVTGPEVGSLLLIGAYRDNEVHPDHPLRTKLELLGERGASICELFLEPLRQRDVSRLIAEALCCSQERAEPLTELIYAKTAGNPFFTSQFVSLLAEEQLLSFEPRAAEWTWNLSGIRAKGFSDNVADLMVDKLGRLPNEARATIGHLACLGSSGETAILALLLEVGEELIRQRLGEALRLGLVFHEGGKYRFLHDRVYEAAYALLPEAERAVVHLTIGRLLGTPENAQEGESIFDIVNHWNRGAALIESREERERAASLNLSAAKRAKASTAYVAALKYCSIGLALLDEQSTATRKDLGFSLEILLAECSFLSGDVSAAQTRLDALYTRANGTVDRAAVTRLQMALFTTLGRTDHAIDVGLAFLRSVGFDWSPHATADLVEAELVRMQRLIAGRPIEALIDLPPMDDPGQLATIGVLAELLAPASFAHQGLFELALLSTTNLSLEHGHCDASPFAYSLLNIVLGFDHGDYHTALRFGQLACNLVDERGLSRFKTRVYNSFATFTLPWTQHLPSSRTLLRRALDAATSTGDLTFAAYTRRSIVSNLMVSGEPLQQVKREAEQALAFARKVQFDFAADSFVALLLLIRDLRGACDDDDLPSELQTDEPSFESHLRQGGARLAVAASRYWIYRLQARFLVGDYQGAIVAAANASELLWASRAFIEITEFHFHRALALAALCPGEPGQPRSAKLAEIDGHYRHLAGRAEGCPENWRHRAVLIAAEVARLEGREMDAMRLYEDAVASAKRHGFVQNEAIASELSASFYAAQKLDTAAHAHLLNARACYERWGALRKVRQLECLHPRLDGDPTLANAASVGPTLGQLDVAAVVAISQAVSEEIVLDRLVEKVMTIAVEHAGAVRGVLLLAEANELRVDAEAVARRDGVSVRVRRVGGTFVDLPDSILRYVVRSEQSIIVDDAASPNPFSADAYLQRCRPRSISCLPLLKQGRLIGALYLENSLLPNVFTRARVTLLQALASQAAISLENAQLYETLQASLSEKQALLKEVHHRVKNNLQLISSLLSLQSERTEDSAVAELFADSRNRVRTMALVHENLYRAGDFGKVEMAPHIRTLCAHLTGVYRVRDRAIELIFQLGDCQMDLDRAVSCGLLVNELVSNALKHGFPEGRSGRVRVELQSLPGGEGALIVSDDGVGLPPQIALGESESLGLQLVEDLTKQLNGSIRVERYFGTTFTISFPAANPAVAEP